MEKPNTLNKIIISKKNKKSKELLETLNSVTHEDISSISKAIEAKQNEPKHDLERAKHILYSKDDHTLQHYKDYYEALEIVMNSKEKFYFMT